MPRFTCAVAMEYPVQRAPAMACREWEHEYWRLVELRVPGGRAVEKASAVLGQV